MGGPPPGGPSRPRGAQRPGLPPKAPWGRKCQFVNLPRPAALQAQASRDLPAPKEPSAREEGKSSDYSPYLVLVPLPWSKRQEGEGRRRLTSLIQRLGTLTMPHRPRPLTCPRVFSITYRTGTLP